ncbi:MAG TPA: ABC transporter permease [Vicinamibacterales bacterium]|nr:ABC transporter permease [Vicinamibacterales bacterium]
MTRLREWSARIGELLRRRRLETELSEELQHHLDLLTDDFIREGHTREDASRLARLQLGGVDQTKERIRDQRGFPVIETLVQDVRYAIRVLFSSPASRRFTLVSVLTLALGIGVNAAVFSLVSAAMLRPLPYADPDRLVSIWEGRMGMDPRNVSSTGFVIGANADDPGRLSVAAANFMDYQARAEGFAGMAGVNRVGVTLTGAGVPEQLTGEQVTPSYFEVLGVPPAKGRWLQPPDVTPGAPTVAVISDALWRERFGAAESIIGQTIRLNSMPIEVVGVMPAGFEGVTHFGTAESIGFWVAAYYPPELLANHADHDINVIARLKPGVSIESAHASITGVSLALAQQFPNSNSTIRANVRALSDDLVRRVRKPLLVLMAIVGLILLIACANVANLLMVRGMGRQREIAVRFALGATRRRVLIGLITQGLVLALLACGAGVALAWWAQQILVSLAPVSMTTVGVIGLDWRVVLFAAAIAVANGVLFGALPALQARRARLNDTLKSERTMVTPGLMRWRNGLMIVEVALSTILLVGAGLMIRSLVVLNRVELGFRTDRVMAMNVTLPEQRYATGDARFAFFEQLEANLTSVAGVHAVGFANRFPMRGAWSSGIQIDGVTMPTPYDGTPFQAVSPGYFETLGFRLLSGRLLNDADRKGTEPVAVVSEAFSRYLDGGTAIGRRLRRGDRAPWITVVGVVADVRRDGQNAAIEPQVYVPAAQTQLYPVRLADVAVYAETDPATLAAAMRSAVWAIDKDQPVANVRTLEEVVALGAKGRRFQAVLFGCFAALALTLAAIGIYGVVSYAVTQRTPEIGLRLALGADLRSILAWVVGDAVRFILIGMAAGLAGAMALSRFVATMLFEIQPRDPLTYAGAAVLLTVIAIGASYGAARRAARIDPVIALRSE